MGWIYAGAPLELFFALINARVRMGPLLWPSVRFCKDSHRQMDHCTHLMEPVVDEELCEQVRFASAGGEWDLYVLYRQEKVEK